MAITAQQVKELRQETSAPVLDCKKALEASNGDFQAAVAWLREKGLSKAARKAGRATNSGMLELYSHGEGRVGVMVEVNCETDFVARTEQFRDFAHEIALQIAAFSPRWLAPENVPAQVAEDKRAAARSRAIGEGKPATVVDRIVEGQLQKFYQEVCLLKQPYIRDDKKTINDLLQETIATIGENITLRRCVRWETGEEA
ncbi:MAG: translation elongation factor Ts [Chloroflexi bacterium]|nr:translation elongation factor Ts [Chloroflexota bacterium]